MGCSMPPTIPDTAGGGAFTLDTVADGAKADALFGRAMERIKMKMAIDEFMLSLPLFGIDAKAGGRAILLACIDFAWIICERKE